ncbi:MAG TPA: hypothetical protein VJX92_09980 [Methylomirabilota bacterium]|nr:hypothetical protein [Methylomirabilota bacterium]
MAHSLLVRAGQWLHRQLQDEQREVAARTDPTWLLRHKSRLVERGTSYGLNTLHEIERRIPLIEPTLVSTIETELAESLDGSEDWERVIELVDDIIEGELLGKERE